MKLVLRLLWQNAKRHTKLATATAVLMVLTTALWIAEPLYAAYAIDKLLALETGETPDFLFIFGVWIGLFVVLSIVRGFEKYVMWQTRNILKMDRREDVYERLLLLDMDFHIHQKTGESIQILEDGADEIRYVQTMILDLIPSIVASAIFLVVSIFVQPVLAMILYVGIAFFVFFSVFLSTKTSALQDKVNKLWISAIGRANDAMTNIYAVKSSAMENQELTHMRNENKQALDEQQRINKRWAFLEAVNFYMLIRLLLIAIGVVLLARGELTLGQLYFFQFTFFRALTPFEMLSNFLPEWNKSAGKIRMAQEILEKPVRVKSPDHPKMLERIEGRVLFDHVSFTYGTDIDTIKELSLEVQPGEHIAFVGHSGAGKSTMAMLINRFYDVTSGAIKIDGVDIRELDLQWWRSQIGLVLQENITFNDSIYENIRYSRPDATRNDVIDAAKRASAHDFIEKLPQGYDTLVGERGIRLSGGERQRVAIARAILKKPSIVVLDEATSALDSITERAVQEGIKELIKGRTSFIIAHRLSTVRSVDRIAILENGKLTACAPHEELLKISPVYKEMVELQHGGLLAE